jgi:hypothetical protein
MRNPKYHEKYFKELNKLKSIKFLFIGKDPYPNDANGIPFCKDLKIEMQKDNCSGRHLLMGFGINIDKDSRDPENIFFELLSKHGIGFVNASYYYIGKDKLSKEEIQFSELKNSKLFAKAAIIISTIGSQKLINKYVNPIKNAISVYHPDVRNRNNPKTNKKWMIYYSKPKGLIDYCKLQIVK